MSVNSNLEDDPELTKIRAKKLAKLMDQTKVPKGVVNFDEAGFKKAIMQPVPVFVDFWAEWCGPCHAVAPVISQLEQEYRGRVLFGKVNTDNYQNVALNYRVMSIPTFIIFHNGTPVIRFIGALPKKKIKEQIDKALKIIEKEN